MELNFVPAVECGAMREIYGNRGYFWYDLETEELITKKFNENYPGTYRLQILYDNIGEGYIKLEFASTEDRLEFFLRYGDRIY